MTEASKGGGGVGGAGGEWVGKNFKIFQVQVQV